MSSCERKTCHPSMRLIKLCWTVLQNYETKCLDSLQSEENSYMGIFLPTIKLMKDKLAAFKNDNSIVEGHYLINYLLCMTEDVARGEDDPFKCGMTMWWSLSSAWKRTWRKPSMDGIGSGVTAEPTSHLTSSRCSTVSV